MAVSDLFFIVETSIQNGMRKPHPTIFYDTLLKLGTDACSCIYIGNNYTDDWCGAKGVKMKCILIDSEPRYLELDEQRVDNLFQI